MGILPRFGLENDQVISALAVNVNEVGESTLISIRPERAETEQERFPDGAQLIAGEVLEFIYMGDVFRTRIKVGNNDDFIVKSRNSPSQTRLQPGEKVTLGCLPEDCRALDYQTVSPEDLT